MIFLFVCIFSPLRRVTVQFFLTSLGCKGSSKEKGPALGSMSASSAVILMPLFSGFSHISASGGNTSGALSFMSRRRICRVPVLLAGGTPGDQTDSTYCQQTQDTMHIKIRHAIWVNAELNFSSAVFSTVLNI